MENKKPVKLNNGEGRIRTSEGIADRFTVCSLWPLGNLSKNSVFVWRLEFEEKLLKTKT